MDYMQRINYAVETKNGVRAIGIDDVSRLTNHIPKNKTCDFVRQRAFMKEVFPNLSMFYPSLSSIAGDLSKHSESSNFEAMHVLWYMRAITSKQIIREAEEKHGAARHELALALANKNTDELRGRITMETVEVDEGISQTTFTASVHAPYALWLAANIKRFDAHTDRYDARILCGGAEPTLPMIQSFDEVLEHGALLSSDTVFTFEVTTNGKGYTRREQAEDSISMLDECISGIHLANMNIYLDSDGRLVHCPHDPLTHLWFTAFDAAKDMHTGICPVCLNPFATKSKKRERCDKCSTWVRQQRHNGKPFESRETI